MKRSKKTLKRSARIFLNDLNPGKADKLRAFLYLCHDVLQYFIDLFWARGEMSASFADLETVHLAVNRFGITTRLGGGAGQAGAGNSRIPKKKACEKERNPRSSGMS